jgi:hypothetical protein
MLPKMHEKVLYDADSSKRDRGQFVKSRVGNILQVLHYHDQISKRDDTISCAVSIIPDVAS